MVQLSAKIWMLEHPDFGIFRILNVHFGASLYIVRVQKPSRSQDRLHLRVTISSKTSLGLLKWANQTITINCRFPEKEVPNFYSFFSDDWAIADCSGSAAARRNSLRSIGRFNGQHWWNSLPDWRHPQRSHQLLRRGRRVQKEGKSRGKKIH